MNRMIASGPKTGTAEVPASKSAAHRLMILSAFGGNETRIRIPAPGADIFATAACLNALGAKITEDGDTFTVRPISRNRNGGEHSPAVLPCGESGSTLRFLLPVAGILGAEVCFHMEGRLPERPLAPLDRVLTGHGMRLEKKNGLLYCSGRLTPGEYEIPGNISSQYITGLLTALSLGETESVLRVSGELESAGYVAMTENALRFAGIPAEREGRVWRIPGGKNPVLPAEILVERDWSGAAFFLCMGAFSRKGVTVRELDTDSPQGDRAVLELLRGFGAETEVRENAVTVRKASLQGQTVDASGIPDLIPALAAVAAGADGETRIVNAKRLRLKESDRLATTADMLTRMGADITETDDGLIIRGKKSLPGGTVSSHNDHRIAMAAAVAASVCTGPVTVEDAGCVNKSFPDFYEELNRLEAEA